MADYKLTAPRLRVLRGSLEAPEVLEVQTLNPDLIAYDRTRARQKPPWPGPQENPFQWLTFLAWHAARREGAIPRELTYEEWEASTLDVGNLDGEEEEAGPTQEAPEPD